MDRQYTWDDRKMTDDYVRFIDSMTDEEFEAYIQKQKDESE